MPIEEAKNAEAEDDTTTFSPKANSGRIAKLNPNLSGESSTIRDPRRESNGLGGLIKKVRGGSLGIEDPNNNNLQVDSLYAGYKKQTPISSERTSNENKSYGGQANLNKLINPTPSSIRNPIADRGDGTITPLEGFPLGSPSGGRSKQATNSKWSNMLNNQAHQLRKGGGSNSLNNSQNEQVSTPNSMGVTPRLQNQFNLIGNKSKLNPPIPG